MLSTEVKKELLNLRCAEIFSFAAIATEYQAAKLVIIGMNKKIIIFRWKENIKEPEYF